MSLAEQIAPHLPNLRRFARLLTGKQEAGDTAVARLLEAIVADSTIFPDLPPRIGLYQCFLSAFTTRLEDPDAQAEEIGRTAARSLAALPPQARQAFLLVSVEEFERDEAAQILEVSESRIDDLLRQANSEIGRQIATELGLEGTVQHSSWYVIKIGRPPRLHCFRFPLRVALGAGKMRIVLVLCLSWARHLVQLLALAPFGCCRAQPW